MSKRIEIDKISLNQCYLRLNILLAVEGMEGHIKNNYKHDAKDNFKIKYEHDVQVNIKITASADADFRHS